MYTDGKRITDRLVIESNGVKMDFETEEEWFQLVKKLDSEGKSVAGMGCRQCNVCLKYYDDVWKEHVNRRHKGIIRRMQYIKREDQSKEKINQFFQNILDERYVITKDESDMISCSEVIGYIKTKVSNLTDAKIGRILNDVLGIQSRMMKRNGKSVRMRLGIKKKE